MEIIYGGIDPTLGKGYCGIILRGNYSQVLRKRLTDYITCFQSFEKTGNPAIPYISAWVEGKRNDIWYEFVSKRFLDILDCQDAANLAQTFRQSVVEHRVYKYLDYQAVVERETLDQQELHGNSDALREKRKKTGFVEAIYKIRDSKSVTLWLKDQAAIESFKADNLYLSLGCLTVVTMEMEAEEQLKRTEAKLALSNIELNREVRVRKRAEATLQKVNQKLKRLAVLDSLTKIPNRRCFDEHLIQEWKRLKREQNALSLIMCDVDYFKLYNDHYGHKAGDLCLYQVAQAIRSNARRPGDLAARYGGEEFAVILANTDARQAMHVAESIRASILGLQIPHANSPICQTVTASLGIASVFPYLGSSAEALLEAADGALYEAKRRGRNCVVNDTLGDDGEGQSHACHKFA